MPKEGVTRHKEATMQRKPLIVAILAAAFAVPFTANACTVEAT